MRAITKMIYTFDELSDYAKRKAHNVFLTDFYEGYSDEENTLNRFCDAFGVSLKTWECGTYGGYHFSIDSEKRFYGNAQYCEGLRLCKYMAKQQIWDKWKNQYISLREACENCSLTGYYIDYSILKPMAECAEYKFIPDDYEKLIRACLNSFFKAFLDEMEGRESIEYFADICECNNYEFYENGELA